MAGAPAVILDHEAILRVESTYRNSGRKDPLITVCVYVCVYEHPFVYLAVQCQGLEHERLV